MNGGSSRKTINRESVEEPTVVVSIIIIHIMLVCIYIDVYDDECDGPRRFVTFDVRFFMGSSRARLRGPPR